MAWEAYVVRTKILSCRRRRGLSNSNPGGVCSPRGARGRRQPDRERANQERETRERRTGKACRGVVQPDQDQARGANGGMGSEEREAGTGDAIVDCRWIGLWKRATDWATDWAQCRKRGLRSGGKPPKLLASSVGDPAPSSGSALPASEGLHCGTVGYGYGYVSVIALLVWGFLLSLALSLGSGLF